MANDLPTYPHVLAEASRFSLSDLAVMAPKEMSPEAEEAYIEELRAYRVRYEKALGVRAQGRVTKSASKSRGGVLAVTFDSADGEADF